MELKRALLLLRGKKGISRGFFFNGLHLLKLSQSFHIAVYSALTGSPRKDSKHQKNIRKSHPSTIRLGTEEQEPVLFCLGKGTVHFLGNGPQLGGSASALHAEGCRFRPWH